MKKLFFLLTVLMAGTLKVLAITDNTVEIVFNGSSATITKAGNIAGYVNDIIQGSTVSITQTNTENIDKDEIIYILSGSSDDGSFNLEGAYKCTIQLKGLSLTNPKGPALNIQNGKRIRISANAGSVNTLADGAGGDWKGCITCKGHTEFRGKGALNITGNTAHAIWSKEYVEIKNCALNILSAVKDGINCNQYFDMTSGTLSISNVGDDGIQVSLKDLVSTGAITGHELADGTTEDSGNFYQTNGTITMSNITGYCIKAEGVITYKAGTQSFDTTNTLENAASGIHAVTDMQLADGEYHVYDLQGRQMPTGILPKGVYIVRDGQKTKKILMR